MKSQGCAVGIPVERWCFWLKAQVPIGDLLGGGRSCWGGECVAVADEGMAQETEAMRMAHRY